jgi:hypothetical protein
MLEVFNDVEKNLTKKYKSMLRGNCRSLELENLKSYFITCIGM